ncbi:MAG: hypothetical protein IAF38_01670, partial [Bacteroidia bacterium]|nr:hypothetical protein [Bacteroidia bacterium]
KLNSRFSVLQNTNESIIIKGISKLNSRFSVLQNTNEIIIGIIDSDKFKMDKMYKEILSFTEIIEDLLEEEGLLILRKPNSNHYLIRLHTEFEPFIWKQAKNANIDCTEFGYSSLEDIYVASKTNECAEDRNFKKFVNKVVISRPNGIKKIAEVLKMIFPEIEP